jgi:hypothetical protein
MKRPVLVSALLVAANLGHISGAQAQSTKEQPLQEVFQTDLVYPQEKGELQLTTGFSLSKRLGAVLVQVPASLEYGITDRWQVDLQWDGVTGIHSPFGSSLVGTGDLSIGTMFSFMNVANTSLHLAVGFELGLPTGDRDKGMSEGFVEYEPFLIAAKDFPGMHNLQIFTQVGLRLVTASRHDLDNEEPAAHELNWGSGFFIPMRRLCITTEFNWVTNEWNHGGIENRHSLTPGLIWRLPHNWEIGIGAPIGLSRKSSDSSVILKLTREF